MVRVIVLSIMVMFSFMVISQNLSLGVGGRASSHWVENDTAFNFYILSTNADTLVLNTERNSVSLINGLSFPIYVRYTAKQNWWVQVNYGYETWRLGITGTTTPTNYAVETALQEKLDGNTSTGDMDDVIEAYREDILDEKTYDFESFERVQYNRLTFSFGSSLNKRGLVTFYYGAGFDLYSRSTLEPYQGLLYEKKEVALTHHILEAMPKLNAMLFAPFFNLGIEKQNIRLGLDFSFFPNPVFGQHNALNDNIYGGNQSTQANTNSSQLVRNIASAGVSLNYTLFNQNFNQAISDDKKNVLDPLVIGRYRQKPKLIQFGAAINFPNFHNSGLSIIDDFETKNEDINYGDSLKKKGDTYLSGVLFNESTNVLDYLYLEKVDDEQRVIDDELQTVELVTTVFLDWGNINSIVKSPKLSAFVRVNPHELFSVDLNVGYQNHTYGIRGYETIAETINDETTVQTKKVFYQENFHEISLGLNAYTQMQINNISRLGFHVGINYNLWLNGRFDTEAGGINDSELLQDFHDYNTGQEDGENDPNFNEATEWKGLSNAEDADKAVFTKADYYNYNYYNKAGADNYYTDYSPYLFSTIAARSYFELRFGIDYYIENLKFNVYAERSLGRNQTMYNNLFSVGMGVALFMN
ncbi:hypothetical protein DNU06_11800 [Putridiphycobacter roseus]|uniref:Uncharacterized protein n=1 Tax=Putridiphycobacter roseus TaxID=2219161 RepID=A0A2W1NBS2_9FLAO|nr:hypothetical protein [Putridiphycobacter roseus]PZE16533.1 hypothetical protein DNU06_11800 [Putridiphycobacter roseus]